MPRFLPPHSSEYTLAARPPGSLITSPWLYNFLPKSYTSFHTSFAPIKDELCFNISYRSCFYSLIPCVFLFSFSLRSAPVGNQGVKLPRATAKDQSGKWSPIFLARDLDDRVCRQSSSGQLLATTMPSCLINLRAGFLTRRAGQGRSATVSSEIGGGNSSAVRGR